MTKTDTFNVQAHAGDVIARLSRAVGGRGMRFAAPLSGHVNDAWFRITLPPGFSHPYRPVVKGCVVVTENGTCVEYQFVAPWLGHLAVAVAAGVLLSLLWPHAVATAIAIVLFLSAVALMLRFRRSEKTELSKRLRNVCDNELV